MPEEISIDKIIPCLPAQHGFLVDSEAGGSDVYKQQITVVVDQAASSSPEVLENSIRKIHRKCDILRTVFDWSTGKELQIVLNGIPPRITVLSGSIEKLKEAVDAELVKLNTISDEPPIRFLIAKVGHEIYLTITYHHILLDGPSITMLLEAIISSNDEGLGSDSTSEYLQWINGNITDHDQKFWKQALTMLPDEDVNIFGDAPGVLSEHSAERLLSKSTTLSLLNLAKEYRVSAATLMQAICSEWLIGFFNKPLVYGSVLSTREFNINENQLGPFINTVPMQITPHKNLGLKDIAIHTQEQLLAMSKAKHVPLHNIAQLVPSRSLFFDIILTITTSPVKDTHKSYEIIWTRENTGFPLSIDIGISKQISLIFTSSVDTRDFDITDAIASFEKYCLERLKNQNESIPVKVYVPRLAKDTQQESIDPNILITQTAKVLNVDVETIDPKKSFLLNGGDSILALKLKNELASSGIIVAVGQIIRKDSLLELAEEMVANEATQLIDVAAETCSRNVPGSISDILDGYKHGYENDYHEQAAFRLEGSLDVNIFQKALAELKSIVASLNLYYSLEDTYSYRYDENRPLEFYDMSGAQYDFDSFVKNVSSRDINRAFSVDSEALLRVYVYPSNDRWYMFISFSALVTDGWSFSTLIDRLFTIYSSLLNNIRMQFEPDNLLAALPIMAKTKEVIKPHRNSQKGAIVVQTFELSKQESDSIIKAASLSHTTPSQYFEKAIITLAKQLAIKSTLIYENGRDIAVDATTTIGPFSYLRQVDVVSAQAESPEGLYYVYENYPRESENRVREDKVGEFNERGVWRRPLLPPTATVGILVDMVDEAYSIDILIRRGLEGKDELIDETINKVIELIRKELINE